MPACALLALALAAVSSMAHADLTERVSVTSGGAQWHGPFNPLWHTVSISADGRYVTFDSEAADLVTGDTNGASDVFVRDRVAGMTERISLGDGGEQGNADSWRPAISGDGRCIAFMSFATNLVPGDTNGGWDVFVRDRETGRTELVSANLEGISGASHSWWPSISADGRYVAFESDAPELVSGDENGGMDVFVRDCVARVTARVSVSSGGAEANGDSFHPAMSPDGRFVAFMSYASNLVTGDTNGVGDIFVHDRVTGTTDRVSVSSTGAQGNAYSRMPAISLEGRFVAFESLASNLVGGDSNSRIDVFVRDRITGTTTKASVASDGSQVGGHSLKPSLSGDGRFVAFESAATGLISRDRNGDFDVFVRDRVAGTTVRASVSAGGAEAKDDSGAAAISQDGRFLAFWSLAPNLVSDDTNTCIDVFVRYQDRNEYSLSITGEAGSVRVDATPRQLPWTGTLIAGSVVTLDAKADDCWEFVQWSGDLSGDASPVALTMDGHKSIGAEFLQRLNTVTVESIVGCGVLRVNGEEVPAAELPWTRTLPCVTLVTLEAEPCECWELGGWSGDVAAAGESVQTILTGDIAIGVTFTEIRYSLALAGDGAGSVRVNDTLQSLPWSGEFGCDETVSLLAVADACSDFIGWSGDASGGANPLTVTMEADKGITASFALKEHTLSLSAAGSGGIRVDGVTRELPWSGTFTCGALVALEAVPEDCWEFQGWSGDAGGNETAITLTIAGDKTVSANFGEAGPYTLAIDGAGEGSVLVNGVLRALPWAGEYACGAQVTLEAQPDTCWTFADWSGDVVGTGATVSITMDGDKALAGGFSQLGPYLLSLEKSGSGALRVNGVLRSLPWSQIFPCGSLVMIEAQPDACWEFTGWFGALAGSTNPVSLTLDSDITVGAAFQQLEHTVRIADVAGCGSVSVNGEAVTALPWTRQYLCGTEVLLETEACDCWEFDGWVGDWSSAQSSASLTVLDDVTISANFSRLQYGLTVTNDGSGSVEVDGVPHALPWSGTVACGTTVALTAVSSDCSEFAGWSGAAEGMTNPVAITVTGETEVVASFAVQEASLTVSASEGGTVQVNGLTPDLPWTGTALCGANFTLEAVPGECWTFVSWSGAVSGEDPVAQLVLEGDRSVHAEFRRAQYTVTVEGLTGCGSIWVNGEEISSGAVPWTGTFECGTVLSLAASPCDCWEFDGWTGDLSGSAETAEVTVSQDLAIGASFGEINYSVTVAGVGSGRVTVNGTTQPLPWSGEFTCGSEIVLEAVPDDCWTFEGWGGDMGAAASAGGLVMDGDKEVVANFVSLLIFQDVGCDHWAIANVAACFNAGIVLGYPDGSYQPELPVSRGQMAVFVSRAMAGGDAMVPSGPVEATFPDVPIGHWSYRYVEYAQARDVVRGYADGSYLPDSPVDRGQMAIFIARAIVTPPGEAGLADYTPPETPTFEDVTPDGAWAVCFPHVEYIAAVGITLGYPDGLYHPENLCTRDQMATYISRAFDLTP